MKINVFVQEVVNYELQVEVPDDFNIQDTEALDELWCEKGSVVRHTTSVEDRDVYAEYVRHNSEV